MLEKNEKRLGARTVEAYVHRPRWELYDLGKDPNETVNLAEDGDYAAVLSELKRQLKGFQKRTKDPWLVKYEYE